MDGRTLRVMSRTQRASFRYQTEKNILNGVVALVEQGIVRDLFSKPRLNLIFAAARRVTIGHGRLEMDTTLHKNFLAELFVMKVTRFPL